MPEGGLPYLLPPGPIEGLKLGKCRHKTKQTNDNALQE